MMPDKIAVLIPCFNEASTIGKVVSDFRKALPEAVVYVYDNNSADHTAELALKAGAVVRHEYQQGKEMLSAGCFRRSMRNVISWLTETILIRLKVPER